MLISPFFYPHFLPELHKPAPGSFWARVNPWIAGGGVLVGAMPSLSCRRASQPPWFFWLPLLCPAPIHIGPHAVSYLGLPQISTVGEDIPLCVMERMGPSGSKIRGQKAPKGQEKRRGQRRGRSVPVSGFEAGHLESLRDSPETQGFGS